MKGWRRLASFFFGLALLLAACGETPDGTDESATATPISVHAYENDVALDLLYPAGWNVQTVRQGLLLFGEPKTLSREEAGPLVAVFRRPPEAVRDGLEGTLQHYLDNGPLQSGFELTTEARASQLGGRDALEVSLESEGVEALPAMKAYVIAGLTESGVVYIFAATAPLADWDRHWSQFRLLVASVEFNE